MENLDKLNECLVAVGVPHVNENDRTEPTRRVLVQAINSRLSEDEVERYAELVAQYGEDNVWDTDGVSKDFQIEGFMAPFVTATHRGTFEKGSLQFCHHPRFYFDWRPE